MYRGAVLKSPINHVDNIPPTLATINPTAMAVARRTCGAELAEFHVPNVGLQVYTPGMVRKRLPYRVFGDDEVRNMINPIKVMVEVMIQTRPRIWNLSHR